MGGRRRFYRPRAVSKGGRAVKDGVFPSTPCSTVCARKKGTHFGLVTRWPVSCTWGTAGGGSPAEESYSAGRWAPPDPLAKLGPWGRFRLLTRLYTIPPPARFCDARGGTPRRTAGSGLCAAPRPTDARRRNVICETRAGAATFGYSRLAPMRSAPGMRATCPRIFYRSADARGAVSRGVLFGGGMMRT